MLATRVPLNCNKKPIRVPKVIKTPCEADPDSGKVNSLAKFMQIGITGTRTKPTSMVLMKIMILLSIGNVTKVSRITVAVRKVASLRLIAYL